MKVLLLSCILLISQVYSHGALIYPPSRNAIDRILPEFFNGKWPSNSSGCNCGGKNGCDVGVRASGNG